MQVALFFRKVIRSINNIDDDPDFMDSGNNDFHFDLNSQRVDKGLFDSRAPYFATHIDRDNRLRGSLIDLETMTS